MSSSFSQRLFSAPKNKPSIAPILNVSNGSSHNKHDGPPQYVRTLSSLVKKNRFSKIERVINKSVQQKMLNHKHIGILLNELSQIKKPYRDEKYQSVVDLTLKQLAPEDCYDYGSINKIITAFATLDVSVFQYSNVVRMLANKIIGFFASNNINSKILSSRYSLTTLQALVALLFAYQNRPSDNQSDEINNTEHTLKLAVFILINHCRNFQYHLLSVEDKAQLWSVILAINNGVVIIPQLMTSEFKRMFQLALYRLDDDLAKRPKDLTLTNVQQQLDTQLWKKKPDIQIERSREGAYVIARVKDQKIALFTEVEFNREKPKKPILNLSEQFREHILKSLGWECVYLERGNQVAYLISCVETVTERELQFKKAEDQYRAHQFKLAAECYQKAADLGHKEAQFKISVCLHKGIGVTRDETAAVKYLEAAAKQGHLPALHNLACAYERGEGVAPDAKYAQELYAKAAGSGYARSQYGLYYLLHEKDQASAFYWLMQAIEQELPQAIEEWRRIVNELNEKAADYEEGIGVEKDLKKARRYYTQAANLGHVPSKYNLYYVLWRQGRGDEPQAKQWLYEAAENGSPYAIAEVERLKQTNAPRP